MSIRKPALGGIFALVLCVCAAAVIYRARHTQVDPLAITLPAAALNNYVGHYDFGNNYAATIECADGPLLLRQPETLPLELLPQSSTNFFCRVLPGRRWIFNVGPTGRVDSLTLEWNLHGTKGSQKALRISNLPPEPEFTNAIVSTTTGGPAMDAALAILKEGGTAADAAMAMALTQVVQAAGAYVSFAGIMLVVYYDAATAKVYYMDAGYNTPIAEKNPRSIPRTGGRTALVPGFMAGVDAIHQRFGKVPFARLFDSAIAVAEKGQPIDASMAWFIDHKKRVLSRLPETKKIFTKPDGKFYVKGDWFFQPELAATLKQVAAEGVSVMYTGLWGRKFVEAVRHHDGKITQQDLINYRVIWQEPLHTTYHDYDVHGPGFAAWGGLECMLAFNLLEFANIKQYGHYTTNAQALFWLTQITGCQNFSWIWPNVPQKDLSPQKRITKKTAANIWTQMQNKTWPYLPKTMRITPHTDGLVVVDQWGNVAAVNHTINTSLWGDTGLFVDGISIPDSAAGQGRTLEITGPGKRLPNSMSPLIILRAGKPITACCATGAGLHQRTIQALVNILDFDMTPQAAVNTPAFLQNNWSSLGTVAQFGEGTFDPNVLDGLKALGMQVNVFAPGKNAPWGYWTGVRINPDTRRMRGGVTGIGQVSGY